MDISARDDWYSTNTYAGTPGPGRDVQRQPVSAPGSPLLPGYSRTGAAPHGWDRFKSHTVGRTEGRRIGLRSVEPRAGDGIR